MQEAQNCFVRRVTALIGNDYVKFYYMLENLKNLNTQKVKILSKLL